MTRKRSNFLRADRLPGETRRQADKRRAESNKPKVDDRPWPIRMRERLRKHLHLLPSHMHGGVIRYVEHGTRPGDFLLAMLEGRSEEAWLRADDTNKAAASSWALFLGLGMPDDSHGTPSLVAHWINHRGLERLGG